MGPPKVLKVKNGAPQELRNIEWGPQGLKEKRDNKQERGEREKNYQNIIPLFSLNIIPLFSLNIRTHSEKFFKNKYINI